MVNLLLQLKDWYWEHREVARIAIAASAVVLSQLLLMVWMLRRLGELTHMRERLSRLADGLALLTDTTESGLSTLLREFETSRKTSRSSTRAAVSKRVSAAAKRGEDVTDIAMNEALSESEIRLHLQLAEAARRAGQAARQSA